MKITCAIIDDEPLARNLLESYIQKTPFLELKGKYSSAVLAMKGLQEEEAQLLFLDIQMPELTGLEFSKMVSEQTRIIFTTAFSQYALEGYKVNALDYLLKPFSYADFLKAAQKACQWFELLRKEEIANSKENEEENSIPEHSINPPSEINSIFVKSEYKLVQIMLDDILYIEGLKDYLKIYTSMENKPILSLMSMKSMEELLPSERFMRVHRSYIVQTSKIRVIDRNRIVFGKTFIPISDSYKNTFNEYLNSRTL